MLIWSFGGAQADLKEQTAFTEVLLGLHAVLAAPEPDAGAAAPKAAKGFSKAGFKATKSQGEASHNERFMSLLPPLAAAAVRGADLLAGKQDFVSPLLFSGRAREGAPEDDR